jgi:subtilisin family serine protease
MRLVGLVVVVGLALVAPAAAWAFPDDPYFASEQWPSVIHWNATSQLHAENAYPTIAVVDSGILTGFDEFAGYLTPDSADCTGLTAVPATSDSMIADERDPPHGTQVASLAAGPINGVGSVGVSPYSPIVAVRVTRGADAQLLRGPVECALNYLRGLAASGPLVVNLSMQFDSPDGPLLQPAIDRLVALRALVVAATGNGDSAGVQWPAKLDHVVAVGDTEESQRMYGPQLDVLAPGANLDLPQHDGTWAVSQPGTSFSTALVSGAAALLWGDLPAVSNPQQIGYLLRVTATRNRQWSPQHGFGTINLAAALAARVPPDDEYEPNDTAALAWRARTCRRSCRLNGIVGLTDDRTDVWLLRGPRACPRLAYPHKTVRVSCKVSGRKVLVTVTARKPVVAYTIRY